ncbi:glycosyltransferase [Rhodospirillum rubrum]|uniref:Glycosyl transferase, group 1 n=1 Tax=Rhodospirillum rubrum (strain ATCC 11170 / ATH 1.1.1 / DSM 467 / LMG 4362 / NCIMB 8255 / S1) TaxID=269796 RepID=Q2RVW9_RHORT|nr:glycosyltransferase [Rhodospirillum rubrum]ABC21726.1 Glycosyl transferase, group 1 [Rhodospirillum rubrum ATCC 11170]AEO47424.1 glycosyl transferase, group 1 [Rhodospirillum rubrum F11]MBK5953279.1 glycosyl transferase family 1 [Rhodospirillum rubrum]QXG81388.1 glycosyltransferase [Rhodospirillum rubrum]HAQ01158.1 glycosyl transferase family 1 [Rhodospirillum rubrum]
MTHVSRIAFIGNSLPRRCGIATFTTHLRQAVGTRFADIETFIVAMTDPGQDYAYPASVPIEVHQDRLEDYLHAADLLNDGNVDIACLQHEFGIFGGEAGENILALLGRLTMPIVTTLHTVLDQPTPAQRDVLDRLFALSAKLIVMAQKARELLRTVYRVPADKIEVIAHGIPDFPFVGSEKAKAELGFSGRAVILTFGLLSPNKGIEVMIDAMPAIVKSRPDAVYVVLGATHPNLVREQGEAYRDSLRARVQDLGLQDHVVFLDRFVDQDTLLRFISMCDIYATPYLNLAQMTSGTLAYSFGLGKPVVSTPYWHARELLADGRGILVPFGDAGAIGLAIAGLLTDDARREAMAERAYIGSRSMIWQRSAERYLDVFTAVLQDRQVHEAAPVERGRGARPPHAPPEMRLGHFLAMCDDTGLFQHAVHVVPDRSHGYCVDDNARALLLACALNAPGEEPLAGALISRLAAFVQHAWNPDTKRFRNFLSFERRWLEDRGSEDSHGRTLWALGECARSDALASRRRWAAALFTQALPSVEGFTSPRAWAFTLLGLNAFCAAGVVDAQALRLRGLLADRLMALLGAVESADWVWFEEGLAYDNARLSQALIVTGRATRTPAYIEGGLRSLRWLMTIQTAPAGFFRPVGSDSFGDLRQPPKPFDQQALEVAATIAACLAAWQADGDDQWRIEAMRSFDWFLGRNDLGVPLVDRETGSCRDGLHSDRPNENRGGESVLSYLLSLAEIRRTARLGIDSATLLPLRARRL